MTAPFIDLYVDQGASFNHIINLSDDVTNEAMNIQGFVVTSQMRRSHYSQNASANIVCTVTDSKEGEITLSMTPDITAGLKAGRYVFDVKTIDQANNVSRILEGIITVLPSVTR
jgi:hypothetical protein